MEDNSFCITVACLLVASESNFCPKGSAQLYWYRAEVLAWLLLALFPTAPFFFQLLKSPCFKSCGSFADSVSTERLDCIAWQFLSNLSVLSSKAKIMSAKAMRSLEERQQRNCLHGACFRAEEEKQTCFLFYLSLILSASLQNNFFGVRQDAI